MPCMGGTSRIALAVTVVAGFAGFFAGCDSRAKASDPGTGGGGAKSKEYESCGATQHCADEHRCFDNVCRRGARSTVGDYYAALGAQQKARGELEQSIDSYNKALGHYDSEKIALPPDVDCAYGGALATAKAKKEHAELGARVLHRCILAVPSASPLRDRALVELATLTDSGLDPLALGRTQLADVYLTRGPSKPSTDKLQVTITPNPAVEKKSFPTVPERLSQPDVRTAMIACWEAYNAASKKDTMIVSIGVKWGYVAAEYEDEPGKYVLKIEAATPTAGAEGAADACVRAAIEPVLKSINTVKDSFNTKLVITVKP